MALIGISGKISNGKDLVGKIIQYLEDLDNAIEDKNLPNRDYWINISFREYLSYNNSFSNWKIKKFADKLKDIICILLSCSREQLENQDFKNKELGEEWWKYVNEETHRVCSIEDYNNLHKNQKEYWKLVKLTPRLLMQLLGTDCGRNIIHPNIWINALFSKYYNHNWIITDVRFKDEAEAIKKRDGILIRVERPSIISTSTHQSEIDLDDYKFDHIIINDGTLDELVEKVKLIYESEIKNKLL